MLIRICSFIASHVERNSMHIAELTVKENMCSTQLGLSSGGIPSMIIANPQLNIRVSVLQAHSKRLNTTSTARAHNTTPSPTSLKHNHRLEAGSSVPQARNT